jgi:hypothetical protein
MPQQKLTSLLLTAVKITITVIGSPAITISIEISKLTAQK